MKVLIGRKVFCIKDMRGWKSLIGLMFDSESKGALIEGDCIWMPFVTTPLHLYFLDKEMRILKHELAVPLTMNPKTWRVYCCKNAKYCLELRDDANAKIGEKVKVLE